MRNIRIADPRERVPERVDAGPRNRRRDLAATLPMLLLVPALVIAFNPVAASSEPPSASPATADATATVLGATSTPPTTKTVSTKAPTTPAPTTAPKPATTKAPATAKPSTTTARTKTTTATRTTTTTSSSGGYILLSRAALLARPMTGSGWATLKSWADKPASSPSLTDQNNQNDIVALAKAIVYARTGIVTYRTDAVAMLKAARGTEAGGDALGVARNVAPLVLAADFAGWHDASWSSWIAGLRTWKNPDRGFSLISNHSTRPNNWGTHAGASRIAIDLYIGDRTDLAKAAAVFRGWTGERSAYVGFKFGDLSWQANPTAPVGVNPPGAVVDGMNVDGILPDDMRRGGSAPSVGTSGVSYTWEALQGALLQSELLHRAGYASYSWGSNALKRAVARMYALSHPATGDDDWLPSLANHQYGTAFPEKASTHPGKAFGFADWLW